MSALTIHQIKTNIAVWNRIRCTDLGKSFLTSVNYFSITYHDYTILKETRNGIPPKNIHCYFAIHNGGLQFYLINDINDALLASFDGATEEIIQIEPKFDENSTEICIPRIPVSKTKPINEPPFTDQIDPADAHLRILAWNYWASNWYTSLKKQEKLDHNVLRVMTIPMEDLTRLFKNDNDSDGDPERSINVMFGLKIFQDFGLNMEFILDNRLHTDKVPLESGDQVFMDVSRPRPPFTISEDFNLL